MAVRPPSSLPLVMSWPTIRGSVSSPILFGSFGSMPKPIMKPWSRMTSTDGWAGVRSRRQPWHPLPCRPALRQPTADQLAGEEVIGREGGVGGIDRIKRRVECDHQQASRLRACATAGTIPLVSDAVRRIPWRIGNAGFDCGNLTHRYRHRSCRHRTSASRQFLGLGGRAFLHFHEEGLCVRLGDEAGRYAGREAVQRRLRRVRARRMLQSEQISS